MDFFWFLEGHLSWSQWSGSGVTHMEHGKSGVRAVTWENVKIRHEMWSVCYRPGNRISFGCLSSIAHFSQVCCKFPTSHRHRAGGVHVSKVFRFSLLF